MEFPFDVGKVLPGRINVIESGEINESDLKIFPLCIDNEKQDQSASWIYHYSANAPWDIRLKKKKEDLSIILNDMGYASAQAQSLRSPITTLKKLLNSKCQKVYMMRDLNNNRIVIGFIKIGIKRLFISDNLGAHHEVDPLCILDFYVHESRQRCGMGHEIFNIMLQAENILPEKLAIDRPSLKFLSFLNKHYNLKSPIVQSNNFVIYPGFFLDREVSKPPIFLYNGKAMQPVICSSAKKQYSSSGSCKNEAEALDSFKVSLCSDELKKNKTFYSSAAKCLMWNDEENTFGHNKQNHNSNSSKHINSYKSNNVRSASNWRLHSAVQSCSDAHKKMAGWTSTSCSLTPVDNVPNHSQRKWDQLQSSWNVLGVKPVDYSFYQNQN